MKLLKLKANQANTGFSLIEVITALAILVIMGSVAFLGLYNYRLRRGLEWDAQKIVAALRESRNRSVTQLDGQQWGVHFENPTSTPDFYQVFYCVSYGSCTPTGNRIILNPGVIFLEPPSTNGKDISFLKVSGLPVSASSVAIELASGAASTTINIDSQGRVSF